MQFFARSTPIVVACMMVDSSCAGQLSSNSQLGTTMPIYRQEESISSSLDADALAVTLSGGAPQAAAQRHAAVPGEPSAGEAASAAPASLVAPSAVAGQRTVSPPAADGRLEGSVSARLTELGLLGALIDGIEGLSGRVDASLEISGTPESPNVSGFVSGA